MRRLQKSAAERGLAAAVDFFDLCPSEIALCLEAFSASLRQQLTQIHLSARMTALAFHAPGRLPALHHVPHRAMTAEEIKQRLLAGAERNEP